MGKYNFDEIIERRGTGSSKWDDFAGRFPGYDVADAIPMWVADMDFRCPDEVVDAIKEKAAFGIYGYPCYEKEKLTSAVQDWLKRRHGWEIDKRWIVTTSGVVPAVTYAVQAFTEPGDGVIIQTPVYYPFKNRCIKLNNRIAVENPLIEEDGVYSIDFEDFEKKASDKNTKLFILCSPHNPVGRVWSRDEIEKMVEICRKHDVLIFSDEIHSDLIMHGSKHTATGSVSNSNLISAYAPSKTFNLAGLKTSVIIIPDIEIRKRYMNRISANEAGGFNTFGQAALVAAYTHGDGYLEELIDYIDGNLKYAQSFINENIPGVSAGKTEGTYFLWADFRGTGLTTEEINRTVLEKAKIAGDLGEWFGSEGRGFIRLNLACPRSVVKEAMERIKRAFSTGRE
jgi:cystathionine beta-lyase